MYIVLVQSKLLYEPHPLVASYEFLSQVNVVFMSNPQCVHGSCVIHGSHSTSLSQCHGSHPQVIVATCMSTEIVDECDLTSLKNKKKLFKPANSICGRRQTCCTMSGTLYTQILQASGTYLPSGSSCPHIVQLQVFFAISHSSCQSYLLLHYGTQCAVSSFAVFILLASL